MRLNQPFAPRIYLVREQQHTPLRKLHLYQYIFFIVRMWGRGASSKLPAVVLFPNQCFLVPCWPKTHRGTIAFFLDVSGHRVLLSISWTSRGHTHRYHPFPPPGACRHCNRADGWFFIPRSSSVFVSLFFFFQFFTLHSAPPPTPPPAYYLRGSTILTLLMGSNC